MRKVRIAVVVVAVFGVIIFVLLNNKAKSKASVTSDVVTNFPVTVTSVAKQKLSDNLSLTGTIEANNDVSVVSEAEGKVTAVMTQVGDYKAAKSVLVQIDDEMKQAALESAEANYERAKKDYERYQSLNKENTASDFQKETAWQTMKVAESQYTIAKRQVQDAKIETPISGIVASRLVDVGAYVQKGTKIADVVDISKLKVKLSVAEEDVFKLAVGDNVAVTTDVYPGVTFEGKIETISDKGDNGHTYPIEITMPNGKEHPLKAGMFCRVAFRTVTRDSVTAIPREALLGSMKQPQVYVVENNVAKLRTIVVGDEIGTNVEVLQGLREGETVVSNGQNNLKDNAAVTVVK